MMPDRSMEELVCAIVEQAAEDYLRILCDSSCEGHEHINTNTTSPSNMTYANYYELNEFFHSDWFEFLTGCEGWKIQKALDRKAKEFNYDWRAIQKSMNKILREPKGDYNASDVPSC